MKNTPDLLEKYNDVMEEQLSKVVIEKVERNIASGMVHNIPHHAVITPHKSTTKLRVIYDASAKKKKEDKSLNECFYRGSFMLRNLCGLLMRIRLHQVALGAQTVLN